MRNNRWLMALAMALPCAFHAGAQTRAPESAAVVMDAQGEGARVHAHHDRGITRLYAFNGFEPEIRHAVDPKWRNVTPYVVLLDRQGASQRVIGPPSAAQLQHWSAAAGRQR